MEKKKLKLKISEGSKKTINNIELAKSKASNSVVIAKKNTRTGTKSSFSNTNNKNNQNKSKSNFTPRTSNFSRPSGINDYEKRKLAEQRATKRLNKITPLSLRSIERILERYALTFRPVLRITTQRLRDTLAYNLKRKGGDKKIIKKALHFKTKLGAERYFQKL